MALMRYLFFFLFIFLITLKTANASDHPSSHFLEWLHDLETEAMSEGVSSYTIKSALESAMLDERVIAFDQKQPEQTINFETYLQRSITPQKIEEGRTLLAENANLLNEIGDRYGVQPQIIVALWGVESSYGKINGHYNVIDSLMTLAFEGRREAFFRKELLEALHIVDLEHIPATALRGSWAGAMGQCQFMPSTYTKYAVDYDGDGIKDIWSNQKDVFASIANYISSEGWQRGNTWGEEVTLNQNVPADRIGLDQHYSLLEWERMGVQLVRKNSSNTSDIQASLIQPDGDSGRSFLIYDNFRALMRWNHSTYFATSVGLLADRIK